MSNLYTQFSVEIPYHSAAQQQWLLDQFAAAGESEDGSICSYEDQPQDNCLWVYAEEYGDIERLANLVADYQQQFSLTKPWILSWAHTCSKMALDSFNGGAVAVFRGTTQFCNPLAIVSGWVTSQEDRRGRHSKKRSQPR